MPITAGAIIGGIGALGKIGMGFSQMNQANSINPIYEKYQKSPYATQALGAASNLFNSRMPGAASAYAGIGTNQANTVSNLQRGSQDASTFLAGASGAQGSANQAYNALASQEGQYKTGMLDRYTNALQMNIAEGDKAYKDMLQKYQIDLGQKSALGQSGIGNIFGGFGDIAGGAMQYGNYENAATANTNAASYNNILKQKWGLGG